MVELPRQKRQARRDTCTDRVLVGTSKLATELADRWGTTKIELYRFLIESAWYFDSASAMTRALNQKGKEQHDNQAAQS